MTHSVNVSGISPSTTKAQLEEYFSFCGEIASIDLNEGPGAVIHFENPSAAKTALMLNGATLNAATLIVTSDIAHQDEEPQAHKHGHPIQQTDKPRAGIAAEYLAKGYLLSDHILQRAIEIDTKQGISKRFLNYMHSLDTTIGARALGPDQTISAKVQSTYKTAAGQAKTVDEQKGISKTATDYYAKAIASPFGQKVHAFYTSTSKQIQDIHEEARRITETHKSSTATTAPASTDTTASATTNDPVGGEKSKEA